MSEGEFFWTAVAPLAGLLIAGGVAYGIHCIIQEIRRL